MQSKPTVTLRRTGPNSAAVEPLNLRAPLPKEVFEEVRAQVETPPLDLSKIPPDAMAGVVREVPQYTLGAPYDIEFQEVGGMPIPAHWSKGALLNVRNRGNYYVITLYPEEEDSRHPERAMRFANTWTCQDFVSSWYSRENPDPRAR